MPATVQGRRSPGIFVQTRHACYALREQIADSCGKLFRAYVLAHPLVFSRPVNGKGTGSHEKDRYSAQNAIATENIEQINAGHAGHHHVRNDDVRRLNTGEIQGMLSSIRSNDIEAERAEKQRPCFTHDFVVVDIHYARQSYRR